MTTYLGTTVSTGYLPGPHALYALRLERSLISYQDAKYPSGLFGGCAVMRDTRSACVA